MDRPIVPERSVPWQRKQPIGYRKELLRRAGIPENEYCEIDRIVQGCTGIRRSTGQHPGGIIVLPLGEDINSFHAGAASS